MKSIKRFDGLLGALIVAPQAQPAANGPVFSRAQEGAASPPLPATPLPNGREDVYKRWADMEALAAQKSVELEALANDYGNKIMLAEDELNRRLMESDRKKAAAGEMEAHKAELSAHCVSAAQAIARMQSELAARKKKLESLEKEKKAYNILRWFPVINLFSELAASISGVRGECESLQNRIRGETDGLKRVEKELADCTNYIATLTQQLRENEMQRESLLRECDTWQAEREDVKTQYVQWKDRSMYCRQVCAQLRHLIDIEAEDSVFEQFLAANPPFFALAA